MAVLRTSKSKKLWVSILLLACISAIHFKPIKEWHKTIRVLKMAMEENDLEYKGRESQSTSFVTHGRIKQNFHRNVINGVKARGVGKLITPLDRHKSRESKPVRRSVHDRRRRVKTKSQIIERFQYADEKTKSYPLTIRGKYVINNPNICEPGVIITVLVIVHTATKHFDRRRNIRASFGSRTIFRPAEVRVVFLLGLPQFGAQQKLIEQENRMYGDIIQGEFTDTYYNLTLKAVMGLRWVTEHCADAKYVLKADDDVIFDMWKFLARFREKTQQRTVWCHVYRNVQIQRRGKWRVSKREFKGYNQYPWSYCSGMLVLMNAGVVPRLYEMASSTPFFWIDDIYVYGILRSRARGVDIKQMPKGFGVSIYSSYCDNIYRCYIVAASVHSDWFNATWNIIQKRSRLYNYPRQISP